MAVQHCISVPTEPGWQTVVLYSYRGRIMAEFLDPKGGRSRWQDVTPRDPDKASGKPIHAAAIVASGVRP